MGINYYEENIYNLFSTAPIQSVYSKKIVHRPDHLLPGYESAVNFFWHRRCITIPNNTALIVDICGQHGMKKRFIYVHYAFIDGITKLQNKSCYFKLETQLVLFQNIGAAFIVKLFRPTLWRWRYYPVDMVPPLSMSASRQKSNTPFSSTLYMVSISQVLHWWHSPTLKKKILWLL